MEQLGPRTPGANDGFKNRSSTLKMAGGGGLYLPPKAHTVPLYPGRYTGPLMPYVCVCVCVCVYIL